VNPKAETLKTDTLKSALPDMELCRAHGWVRDPAPITAPYGFTRDGTIRKTRIGQLSKTQYTRLRLAKLYAAGLTARGTPRKRNYRRRTT
jgi:hypothetical protein